MTFAFLLTWWNLSYLAFLGLSFVFLVAQMAGIDGDLDLFSLEGEADLQLEMDGDLDVDVDADVDVDVDADVDIDVDTDVDIGADTDLDLNGHLPDTINAGETGNRSLVIRILRFAGIGRVPLSLWAMTMCVTFGISGLGLNSFLSTFLPWPSVFFPISFIISLTIAFIISGSASRIIGRYMPKHSSAGTSERDLEGTVGKLVYSLKSGITGAARVKDPSGTMIQLPVFTDKKEGISSGDKVLLLGYDKKRKAFEVDIAPAELLALSED